MSELLEGVRSTVERLILTHGYGGIAFATFVENVVPPIPAEFVLPFAGFLVSAGDMRESSYQAALAHFRRHGDAAVFWGRFVPGLRTIVSLPAGVARMPFGRFALLAGALLESPTSAPDTGRLRGTRARTTKERCSWTSRSGSGRSSASS